MKTNRYAGGRPPAATDAGLWRTARRAARALRAIHHEQVLMWELLWQAGRVPADRSGHDSRARAYQRPVRP